jgi:hypothetical protein
VWATEPSIDVASISTAGVSAAAPSPSSVHHLTLRP